MRGSLADAPQAALRSTSKQQGSPALAHQDRPKEAPKARSALPAPAGIVQGRIHRGPGFGVG
ncbi:hypothetical protein OG609_27610 [Streptomyces sp. NBC_01224]|uniref:hypothetical protein n=1 Tax=unclassified Streptomyces TaxID=2593676 RepID=UPI002E11FA58|nr:hypothetical protein OG609_27610 [Streptomyces sp. NBC_01224]